jgi:hypothetical protein
LIFKLLIQIPKIIFSIYQEHRFLSQLLAQEPFDWVISDNRYGLWNKKLYSVFITHQLQLQMPKGLSWISKLTKICFAWFIDQYNVCWVPDYEGEKNLSGALSHFKKKPASILFIGPLSRMKTSISFAAPKRNVVILLSGPEPQRSILEQTLVDQLKDNPFGNGMVLLIRGLTHIKEELITKSDTLEIKNYVLGEELNSILLAADLIICRSGYSTIMDLAAINRTAVYIPTPGQTEQLYLAKHLSNSQHTVWFNQSEVNIKKISALFSSGHIHATKNK